eukprot:gene25470-11130_t
MDTPTPADLSPGGLYSVYNSLPVSMPMTMQILGIKPINISNERRFRVVLNDGYTATSALLVPQMYEKIDEGSLMVGSIVNVVDLIASNVNGKTVLAALNLVPLAIYPDPIGPCLHIHVVPPADLLACLPSPAGYQQISPPQDEACLEQFGNYSYELIGAVDTPTPADLSPGGLYSVYNSLPVSMPMTMQITDLEPLNSQNGRLYRVVLNDGYTATGAMLSSQMIEMINEGSLVVGSIVQVVDLVVSNVQFKK